ncbi:hypothetical protein KEJ23_05120 [Candidatus Bathyarchaeota archaeon]|nr:hypothetical protein [Candidatus Bathyarchaeota archaeon]
MTALYLNTTSIDNTVITVDGMRRLKRILTEDWLAVIVALLLISAVLPYIQVRW